MSCPWWCANQGKVHEPYESGSGENPCHYTPSSLGYADISKRVDPEWPQEPPGRDEFNVVCQQPVKGGEPPTLRVDFGGDEFVIVDPVAAVDMAAALVHRAMVAGGRSEAEADQAYREVAKAGVLAGPHEWILTGFSGVHRRPVRVAA